MEMTKKPHKEWKKEEINKNSWVWTMHRLTHFIWSRTEVVGMCDITEDDRDKGMGRELSLRMMQYTIGHTHCYHLAPVFVLSERYRAEVEG